jgi:hypothetical protein
MTKIKSENDIVVWTLEEFKEYPYSTKISNGRLNHEIKPQNIIRKTGPISVVAAVLIVVTLSTASIGQELVGAQQPNEVNWEELCVSYRGLVGIHTPCSELAHGTILTAKGKTALGCLFGGGTLLLLGADPTTVAMISKAAREVCP